MAPETPSTSPSLQQKSPTFLDMLKTFALMCGIVVVIAGLALGGYFAVEYHELEQEHIALREKQENRSEQLRNLAVEVDLMREQMLVTRERNERIQGLLGVDETPPVGGPKDRDVYSYVYRVQEQELMERLQDDLEEIRFGIERTGEEQTALEEYLSEREDMLSVLPSLNPAPDGFMTSGFGFRRDPFTNEYKMHRGIDLACTYRCSVYAAADGVIVGAGFQTGYGLIITIEHGYGIVTRYAHLSRIDVREGDEISRGDKIGLMGMTGRSTGIHLHYEVLYQGRHVDPQHFLID